MDFEGCHLFQLYIADGDISSWVGRGEWSRSLSVAIAVGDNLHLKESSVKNISGLHPNYCFLGILMKHFIKYDVFSSNEIGLIIKIITDVKYFILKICCEMSWFSV